MYAARLRMPLLWGALVLLVGGALLGGPGWTGLGGLVLLVAGLALYFRVGTVRRPPQLQAEPAAPVRLHFQLMDHHSVLFAAGLPFRLARFEVGGSRRGRRAGQRGSRSRWPRRADPAGYRLQWVSPSR